MINQEQIKLALKQENPIEQLRLIAITLRKEGLSVKDIYNELLIIHSSLDDTEEEKDILGDFMDMITGYYVGKNIDIDNG